MKIDINVSPSSRHEHGLSRFEIKVHDHRKSVDIVRELDLEFGKLFSRCGMKNPIALDFLLVTSLCYIIDKTVSRKLASDRWTRHLEVDFPVSSPSQWERVAGDLRTALNFLTGDVWSPTFSPLDAPVFEAPTTKKSRSERGIDVPNVVCLFSGGLDSLIGSIDLLAESSTRTALLIGHHDGAAGEQTAVYKEMEAEFKNRAELLRIRIAHRPGAAQERTLRSRSLIFLALGIYAANSFGEHVPLYASENGLIAINVPLTPSRGGSCSTRTMHPYFLDRIRDVFRGLELANPLINPFQMKTKGECVTNCLDPGLLSRVVTDSVSCSHPGRKQNWVRTGARNCGYCVPCIFRRASLHEAGLDHGSQYGIDICAGELPPDSYLNSANDMRAVLDFLSRNKRAEDLERDILTIAPVERSFEYAGMVERGFNEVRALLREKGTPSMCRIAGITGA